MAVMVRQKPSRVRPRLLVGSLFMILLLTGCTSVRTLAQGASETPPVETRLSAAATEVLASPWPSATLTATPTAEATRTPTASLTPTASSSPTPVTPTTIPYTQREQIFFEVWNIIHQHYLYPDFRGVDWDEVYVEYKPLVQRAKSNEEFYALLTEMVALLDDRHSRFLAPSAATFEDAFSTGLESYVGIGVRLVPRADGSFIQEVYPDSPAAQVGLLARDRILAIDGEPFDGGSDLYGPEGSEVRLLVMSPGGEPREVLVIRRAVQGRIVPITRRLEGDIGYLKLPTLWVNDMDAQVSGALTDMIAERPVRGLILDLRGNPGGWNYVLTGVLGHFVRGNVGLFFNQNGTKPLMISENTGPDLRNIPLAVLVDDTTASYAEVIAGVLQDVAHAYVVGVPTAGNTETIYAYELVGGARLWVAQEGFKLLNGTNIEGEGIQPNEVIDLDWTNFSEQEDPHVQAALRYFELQSLGK